MDVERQERCRHGALRHQPRLVHHQPRHSQRGLLSPGRPGLRPRPRPHRHGRRKLLRRGEAGHDVGRGVARARRARLSLDQHAHRRPIPHHQARDLRPAQRCGADADPARKPGRRRLAPVRAACAASGQQWRAQHGLARRLQGPGDAVRPRQRHAFGDGRRLAVPREFGRLRRVLRRVAATLAPFPTERAIRHGDGRQRRPDGRTRDWSGRLRASCARLRPFCRRGWLSRTKVPADTVRNDSQRLRSRMARLSGRFADDGAAGARTQHVSRQHGYPAQPPGPAVSWRRYCKSVDPLGIQQERRRSRRLPSGLAARPLRDGRRAYGLRGRNVGAPASSSTNAPSRC
jgi:hypothetical protein